jgi:nitroreductase
MDDISKPQRRMKGMPPAGARELLAARTRTDDMSAPPGWSETLEVLLSHRSVRAYLPDPLPPGTIEILVAAAQSAASSSNLQCWSVVAVEDEARKARLAALSSGQKYIVQAPLFLVWLVDLDRLAEIAAERDVPAQMLFHLEAFTLATLDCGLAAQNAVVAAESLGLGCVYIGAIRNDPVAVAAELALPPNVFALVGLVVGYPDRAVATAVKPRLPQDLVLFREQYTAPPGRSAALESYKCDDTRLSGRAEHESAGLDRASGQSSEAGSGPGRAENLTRSVGTSRFRLEMNPALWPEPVLASHRASP